MKTNLYTLFCLVVGCLLLFPSGLYAQGYDVVADAPVATQAQGSLRPSYFMQLHELREQLSTKETTIAVRHIIVQGETLSTIAKKYGVTVESLVEINKITNPNLIHVGQVLALNTKTISADNNDSSHIHRVQKGETVWALAQSYGVDASVIMKVNKIDDPKTLEAGQELLIPRASVSVAVTATRVIASRNIALRTDTHSRPDFIWPIVGYISSGYGPRWGEFHYGLDIAAKRGQPIAAVFPGTVTATGWLGSYGYMVQIDHQNGWVSVYGHCSKLYVKAGDEVQKGQTIAAIGQTGNATGPHVHLELIYNNKHQNPLKYLPSH